MMEQIGLIIGSIFMFILTISIIAIPIIIIILVHRNNVKKYEEESYYRITNVSYYNVRHNTGKYGEYLTYKYLKGFEAIGAKFLFNLYIPKKDEETSEIDVLMISRKGVFVFESKNYSGWIFGTDNQRYWYQTLPAGRRRSHKEKFYNPIFQNNTHVKYLKSLIGEQIPFYSIITFSDRCTLKNINIQSSKVNVINRYQVYNLVSSIYNNNTEDKITDIQVEQIYNTLYPCTQVDENTRQQHIANIYNNLNGNKIDGNTPVIEDIKIIQNEVTDLNDEIVDDSESIKEINNKTENNMANMNNNVEHYESLICPSCGAKLVLRKARRGDHVGEEFYGCSNYPKCKFIRKIEMNSEKNE